MPNSSAPPQPFRRPGTRSLLSLDGGGIRGIYAIQILKRIEQIAVARSGNVDIRLCDCFDYIGGTSTGGIIAAALALGMRVAEVEDFYLKQARHMFTPNTNWFKRYTAARYDSGVLGAELREVFGADTTLGSPRLQTLLLLVMMDATTSSPWPLSSNPRALYNDLDSCGPASNLHLPLWQLVRASAAAPFFFAPEAIAIDGREHLFFDGALTSYNNPAFKLFQMATLPEYKLEWETGAERMLLVSVGTGLQSHSLAATVPGNVSFLSSLPAAIQSLMFAGTVEQDLLCRAFGAVRAGDPIDGEVGALLGESVIGNAPLFSYARYNSDLNPAALRTAGFERFAASPFGIDAFGAIDPCIEIGRSAAASQVQAHHFDGFW